LPKLSDKGDTKATRPKIQSMKKRSKNILQGPLQILETTIIYFFPSKHTKEGMSAPSSKLQHSLILPTKRKDNT